MKLRELLSTLGNARWAGLCEAGGLGDALGTALASRRLGYRNVAVVSFDGEGGQDGGCMVLVDRQSREVA